MNKKAIVFSLIVVLAVALRFIGLDNNPPALHADEADTGFTAYTLIKTLKDPYGNFLPFHFQGQADIFRAPLYTYLTVLPVAVLGLNEFSIRFISVLSGVGLVIVVFYLVKKLSGSEGAGYISSFLIAINPWSVHLSRTGLEVHLCLFLLTCGVTAAVYMKSSKWMMVFSSLFFGLSIYTYHAAKIFAPIMILIILAFYWKELIKQKKIFALAFFIFTFCYTFMLWLAIFQGGAKEYSNVNLFDTQKASDVVDAQRQRTIAPLQVSSVFVNKPLYFASEIEKKYIGPISFNYLFLNGENNLDKGLGGYGQYHIFEIVFAALGVYYLAGRNRRVLLLLGLWFAAGLLPGAVTETGYYAYRDVAILPLISIVGGIGIFGYRKYLIHKFVFIPLAIIMFATLSHYVYTAFFAYPYYSRDWWAFDQKEAIAYVEEVKHTYPSVHIIGGFDWIVQYGVYESLQPEVVQQAYREKVKNGVARIGNVYVGPYNLEEKTISMIFPKGSLVITPGSYKGKEEPIKIFRAADGGTNLKAYKIR